MTFFQIKKPLRPVYFTDFITGDRLMFDFNTVVFT